MSVTWRCFDGSEHPVSGRFMRAAHPNLNGVSYEDVERERINILNSAVRVIKGVPQFYSKLITNRQQKRLVALDHVININRALQFLDGRDYRSHNEMFGPNGTLCQVHGNYWTPLNRCGCRTSFIFDHWLRDKPDRIIIYPHWFGINVCERHQHLKGDYAEHYWALRKEASRASYP